MQIVAIGDTHFKVDNMNIVDKLIEEIVSKLTLLKPDLIVLLGDILHDHERLHTLALNRALDFINKLRNISKKIIDSKAPAGNVITHDRKIELTLLTLIVEIPSTNPMPITAPTSV